MQIKRININCGNYGNINKIGYMPKLNYNSDSFTPSMKGRKDNNSYLINNPLEQSKMFVEHGYIPKDVKISDGFMDVGKLGKIYDDGSATSEREIVVVDKDKDKKLNEIIENIKSQFENTAVVYMGQNSPNIDFAPLSNEDKLTIMYDQLKTIVINNYNKGVKVANFVKKPKEVFKTLEPNEKVLLGDCISNMNAKSRHYSLLFKVLADELDIPCELVKGSLEGNNHVWNVVYMSNKPRIYDVMSRCVENPRRNNLYRRGYKEKNFGMFSALMDKFRRY